MVLGLTAMRDTRAYAGRAEDLMASQLTDSDPKLSSLLTTARGAELTEEGVLQRPATNCKPVKLHPSSSQAIRKLTSEQ